VPRTTAISLREAAKQLRRQAEVNFGDPGGQVSALATLLDGDGEGGLLGLHGELTNYLGVVEGEGASIDKYVDETATKASIATLNQALTLVAAYVSAVLGQEVQP
jgi:hypothetical protein